MSQFTKNFTPHWDPNDAMTGPFPLLDDDDDDLSTPARDIAVDVDAP